MGTDILEKYRKRIMAGISDKEVKAIKEFRKRLADILPEEEDNFTNRDDSLIRWIRAREMNLDKAEEMFRQSMKWRAENEINQLLHSCMEPELERNFPYYLDGIDKSGRPIICIPMGSWDIRSYFEENNGPSKFARYSYQFLEKMMAAIKYHTMENGINRRKDTVLQVVTIIDMEGFSYRQIASKKVVQTAIQIVSEYEAHYPETFAKCLVINAPWVFPVLFGMVKPFMSDRTVSKIQVFSNKIQWLPAVHAMAEPSEIRKRFGGSKS